VHLGSTIRRLIAVLMIAGLALAPLSRPAMAATSAHGPMPAMADEMSPAAAMDDSMDEMASAMPCCPSKAPMPIDCDKCVFMAGCMSTGFPAMSVTVVHPIAIVSDAIALRRSDLRPDGFGHPPPEHPPRLLV
jgi:hypothetical protein